MLIYLFVFSFSVFFFYISEKAESQRIIHVSALLVALIFPSVFAGCRDLTIGTDVLGYIEPYFRKAQSSTTYFVFLEKNPNIEPLYALLVYLIASCTDNVAWLLFFQEFIIIFFVYISAYKLKYYAPIYLSIIIYFLLFFHTGLNTVRQMLSLSFCIISFTFLLNHKFIKSILFFFFLHMDFIVRHSSIV
jgi:hypothetical protein